MKKYKLIKSYPFCNWKLGDIIEETERGDRYTGHNYNFFGNPSLFPEFWEEVIEKDYEILSLISTDRNTHHAKGYIINIDIPYKYNHVYDEYWNIHSVKRLSDGEVFTIGDKLETGTIKEFYLPDNIQKEITICVSKFDEDTCLSEAKKIKQPIFTTEDSVEVFTGDTVWHTNLCTYEKPYSSIVNGTEPYTPVRGLFSTKEKAEEYILMNKPCLSINDLKKIASPTFRSPNTGESAYFFESVDLLNLVKLK